MQNPTDVDKKESVVTLSLFPSKELKLPEYQLLRRGLSEQTTKNSEEKTVPKDKKQISPSSLQNPSNPDATIRSKASLDNKDTLGI